MENTMTIEEVLTDAVNVLSGIVLPVALVESVGIPIAKISSNLKACILAIQEENKRQAALAEEQGGKEE